MARRVVVVIKESPTPIIAMVKPGKIYLHVFDGPTGSLSPAALEQKVQSAIS